MVIVVMPFVHSLDKAVGPRMGELGFVVVNAIEGEIQFVRVSLSLAELPAVMSQNKSRLKAIDLITKRRRHCKHRHQVLWLFRDMKKDENKTARRP